MSRISEADLQFCWEQVLKRDPWFRLHYLFAPKNQATTILALHALIAKLEESLDSTEESITLSQLSWWRSELEPRNAKVSAHPVLRVLREGRAKKTLPGALAEPLIAQVLLRLQAEPLSDMVELKDLCGRVGQAKVAAEAGLLTEEAFNQIADWRCAGTGLASLMEFAMNSRQKSWWFVPLELQAKHQFDRYRMQQIGAETGDVLKTLCEWGDVWFEEQIGDIAKSGSGGRLVHRHLVAMSNAQILGLRRSVKMLMEGAAGEAGQWGIKEFLSVWSSSRRALNNRE